jgi:hypothetical protein
VIPGDPDNSILVTKLDSSTVTCGARMPRGRMNPLPAADQAAIRAWVQNGARR